MAQLFFEALRCAGHEPLLASRLRSFDGRGDAARQARLKAIGERIAARLLRRIDAAPSMAPELWFTYHIYHKAPDWLGPLVATALAIPYVVAEASYAPRQEAGPWAEGHRAAAAAIRRADAVIGLNPADRAGVMPLLADPRRWVMIKPFLDAGRFPAQPHRARPVPHLITVAMMRHGDKLSSYRLLGEALGRLLDRDWTLEVIGDGAARDAVRAALAGLGGRVRWAGALSPEATAARLADADLYVWPAINEAFGMALLEAQASGLPVVAGASGGVAEVVADTVSGLLVAPGDVAAFAAAVRRLLDDPELRRCYAAAARRRVVAEHDLRPAAQQLGAVLRDLRPAPAA